MNFVRVILRPDEGTSDRATERAEAFERVCLPEFNSGGFMYGWRHRVHDPVGVAGVHADDDTVEEE